MLTLTKRLKINNIIQYSLSTSQHKTLGQEPRYNPLGIEMLPERLHKQVFGFEQPYNVPNQYKLQRCIQHLRRHDLLPPNLSEIDTIYEYHKHLSTEQNTSQTKSHSDSQDVVMDIPTLEGPNIDEHFRRIGLKYSQSYKNMALDLINNGQSIVNNMPADWSYKPGWTRYEPSETGGFVTKQVDYPLEDALIFDVETCMNDTLDHAPTLAVAFSTKAWYSWTSPRLVKEELVEFLSAKDLIPFKSSKVEKKLVIGHNVGFDRSFMSDQYEFKGNETKFLDTLSLHMCICGLTGLQRAVKVAHKRKIKDEEEIETQDIQNNAWIEKGSLNNLADVYEFHCGGKISKDDREIFVEGSMDDVRNNFQSLMTYCATDVKATFEVFSRLFTIFSERFPHPITLSGMLEMSTMYLPVDMDNWYKYIENSQATFDEYEEQLSNSLQNLANRACSMKEEEYAKDVWLWDLDWSSQSIKPNKSKLIQWQKNKAKNIEDTKSIEAQVEDIYATKSFMRQISPFLPGFPRWYRDLCCPYNKASSLLGNKDWKPGPCLITTQMRITPKLMQLTWQGYPLHFNQKYGWGYLVPNDDLLAQYIKLPDDHPYRNFPIEELKKLCNDLPRSHILVEDDPETVSRADNDLVQSKIEQLKDNTQLGTLNLIKLLRKLSKKKKVSPRFKNEYCEDVEIPGAYFIRLPHKNGANFNVGNPLGKDFVSKMEDGTLSSLDNELAKLLLHHSSSLSYWKNNHKRIKNQMVVALDNNQGSLTGFMGKGAILPRVIVAGTVTRRAVEPTWLTASNQDTARIGSELKAMIQAPEGYCFVGADVDSQELWIASLMGDSYSYRIHGGTGLSYMTLRGSKSDKTDMHSKTASLIGITRSDAKVLNYARIYGAGQKFIERFLVNTNHDLRPDEAKEKAKTIFKETKGVRRFHYLKTSLHSDANNQTSKDKPISIAVDLAEDGTGTNHSSSTNYNYENENLPQKKDLRVFWEGGTESATFNKLEEIASSANPRTPVLDCQISQALEPDQDQAKDFVTSRVNWVVQSSAVDFLHLVLVNMKWLFERLQIDGRFSISIHDEVRYLVKEDDRYKAAFALQVSNLLVRAYFAYKLNMKDLPISVAFFSSVDIDKCLRKEVDMDCKSPSNPYGLLQAYNISHGESLDVKDILKKYTYKA